MSNADDNADIGYGRPPKQSRFRKGQSGNPKGRPKGARNFDADLADVLNGKMNIAENGRVKKVSSQKAALLRLREKALKGDQRALNKLLDLAQQNSNAMAARDEERKLTAGEDDILERFAAKYLEDKEIASDLAEDQEQADDR